MVIHQRPKMCPCYQFEWTLFKRVYETWVKDKKKALFI